MHKDTLKQYDRGLFRSLCNFPFWTEVLLCHLFCMYIFSLVQNVRVWRTSMITVNVMDVTCNWKMNESAIYRLDYSLNDSGSFVIWIIFKTFCYVVIYFTDEINVCVLLSVHGFLVTYVTFYTSLTFVGIVVSLATIYIYGVLMLLGRSYCIGQSVWLFI